MRLSFHRPLIVLLPFLFAACGVRFHTSTSASDAIITLSPTEFSFPVGAALTQTFSASGGIGPYTYSVYSGSGSINSTTGVYTSAVGARTVGTRTIIKAVDSEGASTTTPIQHVRLTVNGTIRASASDGVSLYLGGDFLEVNPEPAYHFAGIDAVTSALTNRGLSSKFNGRVYAIAVSGNSAYVGGNFTQYGSATVQNLAKIDLTTGALDTTFTQTTGPDSTVFCLALSGSSVYVGGSFTSYRGDGRGYSLAKLDSTTGALDTASFNTTAGSGPGGTVYAMAISGTNMYIGGGFTTYRTDPKGYYLAKINANTGVLDTATFNTVASSGPDSPVYALALSGSSLYVGGSFLNYRTDPKGYYLAKVDASTGALDTVGFNTGVGLGPDSVVNALVISGTSLYVGGNFLTYRGDNRGQYLAKVSASTGVLDTVSFNTGAASGPDNLVNSLALSGSDLYVGGEFINYRADPKGFRVARVNALTGVLDTANFNTRASSGINGPVLAIALAPSTGMLLVGGDFTAYRGTPAPYLAKVNLGDWTTDTTFTTGTGPNGFVSTVGLSGSDLYIGGNFTSYRGDNRGYYLAKVSASTGALDTAFNSVAGDGPDNTVNALQVSGSYVYLGGAFLNYRSNNRGYRLARVDKTTGVLDTAGFNTSAGSGPNNIISALTVSGGYVYAGGNFTSYRGDPIGYRLMRVDVTNGLLDNTVFNSVASSGPNNRVFSLLMSGGYLYVGGAFTAYRTDPNATRLMRVNPTTGVLDTASFNTVGGAGPNNSVFSMAISGSTLYLGGIFSDYQGDVRGAGFAAVNAATSAILPAFNTYIFGPMSSVRYTSPSLAAPTTIGIREIIVTPTSVIPVGEYFDYRGNSGTSFVTSINLSTGVEQ